MMLVTLAALRLLMPIQDGLHWPMVPGSEFALNGINSVGIAKLGHVSFAYEPNGKMVKMLPNATGESESVTIPGKYSLWKTLQIAFTSTHDGPIARFGGISVIVKTGHLWFDKQGTAIDVAPINPSDLNDLQLLKHNDSVLAYVNGTRVVPSMIVSSAVMPVDIGLEAWKGSIVAVTAYSRELSVDELYANEQGVKSLAKALFADTAQVTVEAELTAMTPIPDLERIRPYRSALLAEEYKLVRVVSGRLSSLKPGMKIRIFRYGIRAGEKTALKDAKIGDHNEVLIQPYDSDPKFSREFQVDTLDPDISIPLFVDVAPAK